MHLYTVNPILRARRLAIVATALTLLLLHAPAAQAVVAPPATKNISLLALEYAQQSTLGNTARYGNVITNYWYADTVTKVHTASTTTRAIAYLQSMWVPSRSCSARPATPPATSLPVGNTTLPIDYCWITWYHPEWFLTKADGTRVVAPDFPGNQALDPGNAGFRSTWIANAKTIATSRKFDGVYMDDVSLSPAHSTGDGKSQDVAKYTDTQYATAVRDFALQAGDALRAAGLFTMGNVGTRPWSTWWADLGVSLAGHLDVIEREFFSRWGFYCSSNSNPRFSDPASNGNPALDQMRKYDQRIEAAGGHFAGIDYASSTPTTADSATMRYGRGAFLLDWNGTAGSTYLVRTCGSGDPYREDWGRDLGTPTGAQTTSSAGIYKRPYAKGWVYLNADASVTKTASLPAGVWQDTTGKTWSGSITVAPTDAALLVKVG